MDYEAGHSRNLTVGSRPVWSPNGSRIAFLREGQIYLIDSNGSNLIQLTTVDQVFHNIQWSPNGTWLYDSNRLVDPDSGAVSSLRVNVTGYYEQSEF